MRRIIKKRPTPKFSDKRHIRKFLFLPEVLPVDEGERSEFRWLEKAWILQEFKLIDPQFGPGPDVKKWVNIAFMEKPFT